KDKPDNSTVVSAIYWIGKAKAHEGKTDEAKKLAADTIKKYISDPSREAVEQLITQLAQLCVKKKPLVAGIDDLGQGQTTAAAPGSPIPATTDPGAELDGLLAAAANEDSPTARARI